MKTKMSSRSRIESKWAWHYRRLLWLRAQLLKERSHLTSDWTPESCPPNPDMAEAAADEFDRDLDLSTLSYEQEMLYEVEAALKRIENRTYGVCEVTGKPIPAARLKAVPWTRFVTKVEAQLERNGAVARHHLGALGSIREQRAAQVELVEEPPEE